MSYFFHNLKSTQPSPSPPPDVRSFNNQEVHASEDCQQAFTVTMHIQEKKDSFDKEKFNFFN